MNIFNWLAKTWGFDDQHQQEETQAECGSQSYSQEPEPEQKAPGMFDWLWGSPEQSSEVTHHVSEENQYQRLAASEALNIQGDSDFVEKVTRAYDCLDGEDQAFVRNNASRIVQHARVSGAFPVNKIIMLGGEVLERSEKSIAGVLKHETKHLTSGGVANSQQEELDCIAGQIETLRKIGGDPDEIRWLEAQDGNHYLND